MKFSLHGLKQRSAWFGLAALFAVPLLVLNGANDAYIKFSTFKGDATAVGMDGYIPVESWSWGASNTGSAVDVGGAGAGKAVFQDLHFTKKTDLTSTSIAAAVFAGTVIPTVNFAVRDTTVGGTTYSPLEINLTNVIIDSLSMVGSTGEVPLEQVSLNYAKIEIKYTPVVNGKVGTATTARWDLATGTKY